MRVSLLTTIASKFGRRYDKGARLITSAEVSALIATHACLSGITPALKDGTYLVLDAGRMGDFLEDKVWTPGRKYKAERFDCDDFAAVARGQVLAAGDDEGFERAVFVAEICHWPADGSVYHDALLLLDSEGLFFYEPQTGVRTRDIASKVRAAGEIWG